MYRIRIQEPGRPVRVEPLGRQPRVVGRSAYADIVLREDAVSRQHARLFEENGTVYIEDLHSSNGVYVNGARAQLAPLTPDDLVGLGANTLRIEEVTDTIPTVTGQRTELGYADVAPIHEQLVDRDHSSLSFLYRLSQQMAPHRRLEPLLESVLDGVMEVLPAQRGFALVCGEGEAAETCVSRSRSGGCIGPPISRTLVAHVCETRNSVLTADAWEDERFETSDSMVAHEIHAAICVPLVSHETVFGVLYVDHQAIPAPFGQEHLQLLSVIGQVAGASVENVLLTEKQIHQERLAAIGQAASATSHDMRNILLGISGGTQLLETAELKGRWDRVEKARRIIQSSLSRFENLVDSLLTCARKTNLCIEKTPVLPLLREVVEPLEAEAEKRRVRLILEQTEGPVIAMDSGQIHRVVTNLVKNAIEASAEEGGDVYIESVTEGDTHLIRIRDNGTGVAPDDLPRLGQAFFTTKRENGTGLGLAVCFQIMEQHHGRVLVDSTPGGGSTFTLAFPESAKVTARLTRMTA